MQSCLVLSARSEIPRTKYFCIKCFKIQLYEWYQLFFKTVSKNFARYIPSITCRLNGTRWGRKPWRRRCCNATRSTRRTRPIWRRTGPSRGAALRSMMARSTPRLPTLRPASTSTPLTSSAATKALKSLIPRRFLPDCWRTSAASRCAPYS